MLPTKTTDLVYLNKNASKSIDIEIRKNGKSECEKKTVNGHRRNVMAENDKQVCTRILALVRSLCELVCGKNQSSFKLFIWV